MPSGCLLAGVVALIVIAGCATQQPGEPPVDELVRYQNALALVSAASDAIGRIDDGWHIRLNGERDLSARWQGRDPQAPELTPIRESISHDPESGRTAYEVDGFNYYSSRQHLREIYDADGRSLFVDRRNRNAGWSPFFTPPGIALRYRRVVPQVVIGEALARRDSLRWVRSDADSHQVSYTTIDGEHLLLRLDARTGFPVSVTSLLDMELIGDSRFTWQWFDWAADGLGRQVPSRIETRLNGNLLKAASLDLVVGAPGDAPFEVPDGISVPRAPSELRHTPPTPPSQRPPQVETLAPGVYFLRNLRPGFHSLFVAFKRFTLAVDAPTGWFETQQLPPRNFVTGETGRSLSEKYLQAIRQTVPDRPLRFLALTHHHSDHVGGLRVFRDAGATVLASEATGEAVRRALQRPDSLAATTAQQSPPLRLDTYSGQWLIRDATQSVQLIELPADNPKARGFTLIYLPRQKIAFLAGFIYPVPPAVFPLRESVPLSTWFVQWLDASGIQIDRLYNVHAGGQVETWQLDELREMVTAE